jgi:anti-sigma B factor antagonist
MPGRPTRHGPPFQIEDVTLEDGTRVVQVHGELDLATAPALGQRIRRPMFWEGTERVVVDLSGVLFLDSSGASALLLSLSHAGALGRRLVFVCPAGDALRRLQIYGLDSRLELFPTLAEAQAALAGPAPAPGNFRN